MIPSIKDSIIQVKTSLLDFSEPEILNHIFNAIYDPSKSDASNLKALGPLSISKRFSAWAIDVKNQWISEKGMNLNLFGCRTANEAVKYVIKHRLTSANLSAFGDLNDDDLDELSKNVPHLKTLSLGSHRITGDGFVESIVKFTRLESLKLVGLRRVSGVKIMTALSLLIKLKSLILDCRSISGDQLVDLISKITMLRRLEIRSCSNITGDNLVEIAGKHTELESLSLSGCGGFSSECSEAKLAAAVCSLPKLRCLDLHSTAIFGDQLAEAFAALDKPSMIEILDLSDCRQLSCEWLEDIIAPLPNLRSLNLSGCEQLFGDNLANALNKRPMLEILDLNRCTEVSGSELVNLTSLHSLNLDSCAKLKEIAGLHTNLRSLNISGCKLITSYQFVELIEKFTLLNSLSIGYCEQISEDKLAEAFNKLAKLESLNIMYCKQISGDQLVKIARSLPLLKSLIMGGLYISDYELPEAIALLTKLESLDLTQYLMGAYFNKKLTSVLKKLPMFHTFRSREDRPIPEATDFSLDRKKKFLNCL